MKIPKPGADFPIAPAGTWPAVCYRILDLGTQPQTYQGKPTEPKRMVMLSWELHGGEETMMKDKDGNDVPFTVHRSLTWSMGPKANLRKLLESWRGKPFTEADFGSFEMANLLGAPCLLGVTQTEKNGNTYANVTSVLKLPKGIEVGKPVHDKVIFYLGAFDIDVFSSLSEKMQEKIKSSPEYQELDADDMAGANDDADVGGEVDDEIPF